MAGDLTRRWPSGKSRGRKEAAVLAYEDARDVFKNVVERRISGLDFKSVREMDSAFADRRHRRQEQAWGERYARISLAFARALANEKKQELWELLQEEFFGYEKMVRPLIFSNLVNGGSHAKNNLSIQEYMVIAGTEGKFTESVGKLIGFYRSLGDHLKKRTKAKNIPIGTKAGTL